MTRNLSKNRKITPQFKKIQQNLKWNDDSKKCFIYKQQSPQLIVLLMSNTLQHKTVFTLPSIVWSRSSLANRNCNLKKRGRSKLRYFPSMDDFLYNFNGFCKQRLNCIFSDHAICTAHDYFIIVTHTLCLSAKKHYHMLQ